ncbi:hypothetical protein LCM02_04755 [Lutimonas saemankumensis]|uniref:hypothetical protein n=1 Tax=Lutimonas saemankumensis TaxID=483016 RepID=UPI001CD6178C|nr:hypothetical protein [Lutimonas saemankumensis]MCA0931751.1 hypothetical protein [Lutimonas saemankumensis]
MKKNAILLILLCLSISSYSQRKIKKVEVREKGFNIKMNFEVINDKLSYNGLDIQVIPISANEMNDIFMNENFLNGKFEYSHYDKSRESYFLKKRRGKRKKTDLEFYIEGISWLFDNDHIDQSEYDELEKSIIYYFDEEYAKNYYESNTLTAANPYYVNGKYLNLFKVIISNPSSSQVKLNKRLLVENGNILLDHLSTQKLLNQLDSLDMANRFKLMTLERHHYKSDMVIPGNSTVEKLLAVLPVNFNQKDIKISLEDSNQKFSWKINKVQNSFDDLYTFYELRIHWKTDFDTKFSVIRGNTSSVFMDFNKLFVGEESLNNSFDIFTISLDRNTLSYGRRSDIKGSDFLDMSKLKRKIIDLEMEKIEELKKKVRE